MDYQTISMLNVSATQEQQRMIEAQQRRIEELEVARISQLEAMLIQLQSQIK